MTSQPVCYARHRFPAEIISHAVYLYHVFSLSLRDVGFRRRSRQITIPGMVLFGHDSSRTGERGGWNASHAVGLRFRSGLSAPHRATDGSVAAIVAQ
jgi:hypothetical protein